MTKPGLAIGLLVPLLATSAGLAATPPTTVNYQGVLRNASDKPLTGAYDTTFRFFDAPSAGNEIMVDAHTAAGSGAVSVANGLFNAALGGGTVTDGAGAGSYTSLGDVFRDFGAVWVEIRVGAETLSPRVKIHSAAYALNATNLSGRPATGYLDTSSTAQTKIGSLTITAGAGNAVDATGSTRGGWFKNSGNATAAELATSSGYGVTGLGINAGGLFRNYQHPWVEASLATGANDLSDQWGIYATGSSAFKNNNHGGGGAWFRDLPDGQTLGISEAKIASDGYGVYTYGDVTGGYFANAAGNGYSYVGYNGYGIEGFGTNAGGYFDDAESHAHFYAASNTFGAYGEAPSAGDGQAGYFHNAANTAYAVLGTDASSAYAGPFGVKAVVSGNCCATSWAEDNFDSYWGVFARMAYHSGGGSASISGNAAKNFVQNHPFDSTKLITYSSLEGDEVGTYTRGSGRLVNGEARVPLGETFQWVTNPDVGLTAQVTARGSATTLYVASLSATELVVRRISGDPSAQFNYSVQGLRIGFEESPVVADRTSANDAKLPAVTEMAEALAARPDLQRFTALSRFRAEASAAGFTPLKDDMARALALRKAIGEYDREKDDAAFRARPAPAPAAGVAATVRSLGRTSAEPMTAMAPSPKSLAPVHPPESSPPPPSPYLANTVQVEVGGTVSGGELLALDPAGAPELRPATVESDPRVVGIVAGEPGAAWTGTAPLAVAGTIVLCRVDASAGAIAPGDLLVTSATPGHAMRSGTAPAPGTIVGKALEPLAAGQALIRVLAMAR